MSNKSKGRYALVLTYIENGKEDRPLDRYYIVEKKRYFGYYDLDDIHDLYAMVLDINDSITDNMYRLDEEEK